MPAAGPAVAGARGPRILALIAEFTHTVELVTLAPAARSRWTTFCSEPQPAQALLSTASAGGAGPDSKGAPGVSPDHLIT